MRIHHFFEEICVGNDVIWGEGGFDGREGALFELLPSFLVNQINCMLPEATLHIATARSKCFFRKGTVVEVADDGLEFFTVVG